MWKYVEGSGHIGGIPARDIPDAEAKALGIERVLRASRSYRQVSDGKGESKRPVGVSAREDGG